MKHRDRNRKAAGTHRTSTPVATHRPDGRRWRLLALLILVFAVFPAGFALVPLITRHRLLSLGTSKPDSPAAPQPKWEVGMLRPNGLRIIPFRTDDRMHLTFLIRTSFPTATSGTPTGWRHRYPRY
jgi:hypothetical protein